MKFATHTKARRTALLLSLLTLALWWGSSALASPGWAAVIMWVWIIFSTFVVVKIFRAMFALDREQRDE